VRKKHKTKLLLPHKITTQFQESCGEDYDMLARMREAEHTLVISPYILYFVKVCRLKTALKHPTLHTRAPYTAHHTFHTQRLYSNPMLYSTAIFSSIFPPYCILSIAGLSHQPCRCGQVKTHPLIISFKTHPLIHSPHCHPSSQPFTSIIRFIIE
jgi:hypothetical protein